MTLKAFVLVSLILLLNFLVVSTLTVAGKLECCVSNKTPCDIYRKPTNVVIYEKHRIRRNKPLSSALSDPSTGNFAVTSTLPGSSRAYVQIEHSCNAKPGCRRLLKFDVPDVFVKRGWTFSITHLNLRNPFHGSNTDICK
ncbi:hypothetical protein M3Y94_01062300 [Aphelenchoides besseyi]|nr:hypothetical protein M3Y94_01062300 [Aphelenchoides besseyi]KAI6224194.1 hypothetical protein M3Y95_00857200 [Aphelenchoides besseyi]